MASQEVINTLYNIEYNNIGGMPTQPARLSINSPIYNIDLNTRKIETPTFLGVQNDHQSDIIYFKTDRFFGNFDLSHMIILVHYCLSTGEQGVYTVPFVDIYTYANDNKILFPWGISGIITKDAGQVTFQIKFFKTGLTTVNNDTGVPELLFELNTMSTTSKILLGLTPNFNHPDYRILGLSTDNESEPVNKILLDDELWLNLQTLIQASGEWKIYWNDV